MMEKKEEEQKSTTIDKYYSNLLRNPQLIIKNIKLDCQEQLKRFIFDLSNYQNSSFYGKVERSILLLKKKIVEVIFNNKQHLQRQKMNILRPALSTLANGIQSLLKINLLTFITEISEIETQNNNPTLRKIVEQVLAISNFSLRLFFAYKKYLRKNSNDNIIQQKKKKTYNSDKRLSQDKTDQTHPENRQIEEAYFQSFQKSIQNMSIKELINDYLKDEEEKSFQILEMCKICSRKIKFDQITSHVYYCQKKFILKHQLSEIQSKQQHILNKIKQQQLSSNYEQRSQDVTQLMKVFKTIVKMTTRGKARRRSSLLTWKKSIEVTKQLHQLISKYTQNYGVNDLIFDFEAITNEKQQIEKKLQTLEASYLNKLTHDNDCTSNSSSLYERKSRQSKRSPSKIYNKSTFASQIINKQISSSSSLAQKNSKDQQSNHEIKENIDVSSHKSNVCTQKRIGERSSRKSSFNQFNQIKKYFQKEILQKNSKFCERQMPNTFDLSSNIQSELKYQSAHQLMTQTEDQKNISSISLQSFQILQFLGKGAFGKVYMVKRKLTEDIYALKVIKINQSWGEKELNLIKSQYDSFKKMQGEHLVKAHFSFSQGLGHFFVMEYMPGGDLGKLLSDEVYLEEQAAKFYIAEIILGIEHLHRIGIIHRDLKPQNVVIDHQGHLKLTDFGLSEVKIAHNIITTQKRQNKSSKIKSRSPNSKRTALVNNKATAKLIGTPDYVAIEIINKISVDNETIDWWSLGVIAYEMIIGVRPFCADTIPQVVQNIVEQNIEWPKVGKQEGMISFEAKDLITKLLDRNFVTRLGSKGSFEIKLHPFFKEFDWENVRKMTPPIQRSIRNINELKLKTQNKRLRQQIYESMQIKKNYKKLNKDRQMKDFIRFDLLGEQTKLSALRNTQRKQSFFSKVRSFASSLNDDDQFSQSPSVISKNQSKCSQSSLNSMQFQKIKQEDQLNDFEKQNENK